MGGELQKPNTAYLADAYGQADYLGIAEDLHYYSDVFMIIGAITIFGGVGLRMLARYYEKKFLNQQR